MKHSVPSARERMMSQSVELRAICASVGAGRSGALALAAAVAEDAVGEAREPEREAGTRGRSVTMDAGERCSVREAMAGSMNVWKRTTPASFEAHAWNVGHWTRYVGAV